MNLNGIEKSPPLQFLEESMSELGISKESTNSERNGSNAIGARIAKRSLRQRTKSIDYSLDKDDDTLRGVNRRSIARPRKNTSSAQQSSDESDDWKSAAKFYMKKPLGRLKNTNLETIYEDFIDDTADVGSTKMKKSATAFGLRKLKRRLTFTITKKLKEQRKKRVFEFFGRIKRKRISEKNFIEHWNALNNDDEAAANDNPQKAMEPIFGQSID